MPATVIEEEQSDEEKFAIKKKGEDRRDRSKKSSDKARDKKTAPIDSGHKGSKSKKEKIVAEDGENFEEAEAPE